MPRQLFSRQYDNNIILIAIALLNDKRERWSLKKGLFGGGLPSGPVPDMERKIDPFTFNTLSAYSERERDKYKFIWGK